MKMSKPIHIAIGSTMSRPGNVSANLKEIAGFARQSASVGADVLLTPELSACGYGPYPEVLATAEKAGAGPIYESLAATAQATGVVLCAGFVEASREKKHLAHYVVYPDGEFIVQRKHRVTLAERPLDPSVALSGHPPNAADPADPGQPLELRFEFFEIKGVRCALTICADGGIENVRAIRESALSTASREPRSRKSLGKRPNPARGSQFAQVSCVQLDSPLSSFPIVRNTWSFF